MKKVLEIINLPNSAINFIGGQFRFLSEEGGCEMFLICSPGCDIEEYCKENGVKYFPVVLERQLSLWKDFKALWQICRYIKRHHIDVVIAHQAKARLLGMFAGILTSVPNRVIFAHGIVYETMTGIKRWIIMQNDRLVSSMATKVVCVSNYVKNVRLRDKIDKPEKQLVLGRGSCNGIDTINKFNPSLIDKEELLALRQLYCLPKDCFVIGFCGRLVRDKGVVELVEAFEMLSNKYINTSFKLLIIGQLEVRDALPQNIVQILKNNSDIVYTGPVPFDVIQKYYMLMDVLVLPTHREGFGMVAIEASAMERPVIVSDYTGSAETILENITGLFIDKTPQSIVCAIEKCFDKDFSKKLGKAGRHFVCENFEHKIIRKHVLDLIDSF